MNWDDLRFFLEVVRRGTLSAAAEQLGVNHTTVSRRLKALQERAGVRFLDRLPSGWAPTPAGSELRVIAEQMEEQAHTIDRLVLGRDDRLRGTLRVATIDMLAVTHTQDIADFGRRYPNIQLEVSVDNRSVSLTKREADVALRVANAPPEHLIGVKVGRLEYAPFAAAKLVEESGGAAGGYRELPWVSWDERLGARMTEAWMQRNVPGLRVVARYDATVVLHAAVRAGVGAALLPVSLARRAPELVRLGPAIAGFGVDVWLLTHPDLRTTARVRAFMDHMTLRVREHHRLDPEDVAAGRG